MRVFEKLAPLAECTKIEDTLIFPVMAVRENS